MKLKIKIKSKTLEFDSNLEGLMVNGKEYSLGKNGELIYDQTAQIKANKVTIQMAANTSTLIPALKVLDIPYHKYFDQRDVIESQNNISFYWKPSKLSAYYNRYSTDHVEYTKRAPLIRNAVTFLITNTKSLPLKEELPDRMNDPIKLLGFYR